MRTIQAMMAATLLAVALGGAGLAGAQTYKWVDEKGVTNYGPTPPPGANAQAVDTQSAGTTDSSSLRQQKAEMEREERRATRAPARGKTGAAQGRGMTFDTYSRLQTGMTEGELRERAGPPDRVSQEGSRRDRVRFLYYSPTIADPFLTVVTVRDGRIASIERTRKTY